MVPDDPRTDIERDLKAALRAAAGSVNPSAIPLQASATARSRRPRGLLRSWVAPAAAAAAVIAIGVPTLILSSRQADTVATPAASQPILTEAGGVVTAAGVRFPLPDGWTARAVEQTDIAVTVCAAETPSRDCAGVTVRIAIPDAHGGITPVPDALSLEDPGAPTTVTTIATPATSAASTGGEYDGQPGPGGGESSSSAGTPVGSSEAPVTKPDLADALCPMLEDTDPVGGRPAQHLMIGSCAPGSPQAASWYVTDGSLSISTPRGAAAAQAAQIAAGVDFSGYAHAYGSQIAYLTSAEPMPQTSAPASSSLATAPLPTITVTVPPASSGAPLTASGSTGAADVGTGAPIGAATGAMSVTSVTSTTTATSAR